MRGRVFQQAKTQDNPLIRNRSLPLVSIAMDGIGGTNRDAITPFPA